MVEFAYKLQLHYNIDMLVDMQKETYHENQQHEIFKIKDVQNIL